MWDGLYTGPKYWAEQHDVNRGGEAWPLYAVMLVAQEWLVLALGAVGIVATLMRRGGFELFLVWLFLASLAAYSFAGERFAWLVLQPLLPLVLLAGVGMQALWSAGSRRRIVAAAVAGLAAVLFAWSAFDVSVNEGTDPRELLVVVHTGPDALGVRDRVLDLARRDPGLTVTVDGTDHSTFPWAWYFRDLNTGFVDMTRRGYNPAADVLVMSDPRTTGSAARSAPTRRGGSPSAGSGAARTTRSPPRRCGAG